MADDPILYHAEGEIATLTLNRPDKRNALDLHMWRLIPTLLDRAEADAHVKVVVITGDSRAFAAGADIAEFVEKNTSGPAIDAFYETVKTAMSRVETCPKPTIAAIRGLCIGGGCGLALSCDIRFAAADARLGITPAKLGLVYSVPDTRRLVAVVGPSRARDMLFTGRLLDADEAARAGLVDFVVPVDDFDARLAAYTADICANSQYSVRGIKEIVRLVEGGAQDDTPHSLSLLAGAFSGEDYCEGTAAFLEKRRATFPFR